jgi:hypothetical protein
MKQRTMIFAVDAPDLFIKEMFVSQIEFDRPVRAFVEEGHKLSIEAQDKRALF